MSSIGYGSLKDGPDLREVFHEHRLVIDGAPARMVDATASDLAYLAGIIDGEGSIMCRGRSVVVQVSNTYRPLMVWISLRWGGRIYTEANDQPKSDGCVRKPAYRWRVSGPRAVPILEALQPLLIIKADKAAAALKLWANR